MLTVERKIIESDSNFVGSNMEGLRNIAGLPVDGDGHHVHEGGRHVAVEKEGEEPAQRGPEDPLLVDISGGGGYVFVRCKTSF